MSRRRNTHYVCQLSAWSNRRSGSQSVQLPAVLVRKEGSYEEMDLVNNTCVRISVRSVGHNVQPRGLRCNTGRPNLEAGR